MNKRGRRTEAEEAARVEARRVAHVGLLEAIMGALRLRSARVPCQGDTELDVFDWLDDRDAVQQAAAVECGRCSVRAECLAYVEKFGEAAGVWGGLTVKDRKGRK